MLILYRLPIAKVSILNNEVIIQKCIPSELVICIYDQAFNHWDSYISNYLTLLKDFREILNKLFSNNKSHKFQITNNTICLDKDNIKEKYFTERDSIYSFCITKNDRTQYTCIR